MNDLRQPQELNASLYACILPLRGPEHSLVGAQNVPKESDNDPFLPARASWKCPREVRTWSLDRAAEPWAWPDPVLIADTRKTAGAPVVFGRSAATVAEASPGDQPVSMNETRAASLWHVPGAGFVIALERLALGTNLAAEADDLGSLLTQDPATCPVGNGRQAGVGQLLERLWGASDITLHGLFGHAIGDLDKAFTEERICDLLIPRTTAIAGRRQIEGLVTGISSSIHDLGIASLLLRSTVGEEVDFDELDARQGNYHWAYTDVVIAGEQARPDAVCAMRSDARVAVLDMDAFSIYHDYLGEGGDTTVLALIPMAAVLGRKARDFWDVSDEIGRLAGDTVDDNESVEVLAVRLKMARKVRGRLELRRLLARQLLNDSNFKAWTNATHLRRELAPTAMLDVVAPDAQSAANGDMAVSLEVMERLLERQLDERRLQDSQVAMAAEKARAQAEKARAQAEKVRDRAENRTRTVLQAGIGAVTGAGLLGLFAAFASMPPPPARELASLTTAGLWTLLAASALGVLVAGGLALLQSGGADAGAEAAPTMLGDDLGHAHRGNDVVDDGYLGGAARKPSGMIAFLVVTGVLLPCALAITGLFFSSAPWDLALLAGGVAALVAGVSLVLRKLHPLT